MSDAIKKNNTMDKQANIDEMTHRNRIGLLKNNKKCNFNKDNIINTKSNLYKPEKNSEKLLPYSDTTQANDSTRSKYGE